jgi:hypothetical protein
VPAGG